MTASALTPLLPAEVATKRFCAEAAWTAACSVCEKVVPPKEQLITDACCRMHQSKQSAASERLPDPVASMKRQMRREGRCTTAATPTRLLVAAPMTPAGVLKIVGRAIWHQNG